MEHAIRRGIDGVAFVDERFTDLDFANDVVIFAETEWILRCFLMRLGRSLG